MPQAGIRRKSIPAHFIVWLIFLLAFSLRLWGNTFGLPYFFHPDEARLTIPALEIAERGQWNPGNFIYPTGFIYLLFFGFKLISFFGLTFQHYQADLILFHWLGRFYSALLGAGSVWLIYALGKKAYGSSAGIVAALFLGLNFVHIKESHYATTDVMNLFFVLLSIFFIFSSRLYLAGLFAGIAIGVKYNAWPIIFPLLIASKKKFIHILFFCILGFFLSTPFAFIDLRHFLGNFIEILIVSHSKWLGITHASLFYYFYEFKPIAGVGVIFILSLLGLFSRFKNWSWHDTILTSVFLPTTLLVSLSVIKLGRYFLMPITLFILWAGLSLDKIAIILSRPSPVSPKGPRGRPRDSGRYYFILSVLVIVLSVHPLLKAIRYDQSLEKKDTRIKAAEWMRENIPSASHLALFAEHPWSNPPIKGANYQTTTIPLVYKNKDRDREIFKLRLARYKVAASLIKRIFDEEFSPELFQKRIDRLIPLEDFTVFPLRYFKEKGVDYIIINGFLKGDLLDKEAVRYFPKLNFSSRNFFRELEKGAELVYSLPPIEGFGSDYALSPSVEIYKLKANPMMVK